MVNQTVHCLAHWSWNPLTQQQRSCPWEGRVFNLLVCTSLALHRGKGSYVQTCTLFQGMLPQWETLCIMPPATCRLIVTVLCFLLQMQHDQWLKFLLPKHLNHDKLYHELWVKITSFLLKFICYFIIATGNVLKTAGILYTSVNTFIMYQLKSSWSVFTLEGYKAILHLWGARSL